MFTDTNCISVRGKNVSRRVREMSEPKEMRGREGGRKESVRSSVRPSVRVRALGSSARVKLKQLQRQWSRLRKGRGGDEILSHNGEQFRVPFRRLVMVLARREIASGSLNLKQSYQDDSLPLSLFDQQWCDKMWYRNCVWG